MIPLGLKETKELDLLVPLKVSFGVSLISAETAEIDFPVWKSCQKVNSWRGTGLKIWDEALEMLQSRKGRRLLLSGCFLVGRRGKFLHRIARNLPLNHKNQDFLLFPNPGFHQWTLWRGGCPVWKGNQGIHGAETGWCPWLPKFGLSRISPWRCHISSGGVPSSFLQIPYLSLCFRVQHSYSGAP